MKTNLSPRLRIFFVKKILEDKGLENSKIFIACEFTREDRVKQLADRVFDLAESIKIRAIDFDQSSNRYLEQPFKKEREETVLKLDLWALENEENYRKYHDLAVEKVECFRKAGPEKHQEVIREYWKEKLEEFKRTNKIEW